MPVPRPGEVLVRLRAAALNFRDLAIAGGKYRMGPTPPGLVPLSDGAGEVAAVGAGVTRWREGDRVMGAFMQDWVAGEMTPAHGASALGGALDGVLAEYRVFPAHGLVGVPGHLDWREAATLPCAGVTAWNALFGLRPVLPGQSVLILGTGGVSIFALQFARLAGARVIATSSSDGKLARVAAIGAAAGINYRVHEDWEREVLRLTEGRGVDHVVEVGGPGTLARSMACTRLGGVVTLIGVLSLGQIDPLPILGRGLLVRGILVGSRAQLEMMADAMTAHALRPVIDRAFAFEAAPEAYSHLRSGAHVGKVVIDI